MLTQDRLKELLDYDPTTGIFTNTKNRSNVKAGQVAGVVGLDGYRFISIDNKRYRANRLAWLWMTGILPSNEIDHKNCRRDDDRWENLRHATRSQNMMNAPLNKANTSGIKGVSRSGRKKKPWCAKLMVNYKNIHLGRFETIAEAEQACILARNELHKNFANHG